jgi:hypothetical protein
MTTEAQKTFTFASNRSRSTVRPITEEQHAAVNTELESGKFASMTKAIQYLIGLGWSDGQIAQKIRYNTDTMNAEGKGHRAGDPLRVQHVNNIRRTMK